MFETVDDLLAVDSNVETRITNVTPNVKWAASTLDVSFGSLATRGVFAELTTETVIPTNMKRYFIDSIQAIALARPTSKI